MEDCSNVQSVIKITLSRHKGSLAYIYSLAHAIC